jgi:replicative DNA helicase
MTRKSDKPAPVLLPDFGKVPPQAQDMEEAVLGAVLLDRDALLVVIDFLSPESFYREAHQKIFSAVLELNKLNNPTDIFSVSEYLRARSELDAVGGPVYITSLISKVVSTVNVEYHARIIAQRYMQREVIRISAELQNRAFDDTYDVSELLDYGELNLMAISGKVSKKKAVRLGVIVDGVFNDIEKIQNGEIKLVGVPTGFTNIDRMTGGLRKEELIIIAGRPSTGKTAFGCQIAKNVAELNYPVAFFSCEMSASALGIRYLSGASGRTNIELINGKCDLLEVIHKAEPLQNMPLYIDDTSSISVIELRAKVRKMINEFGIKLVIVDYLQLMTGQGDNREQQVASISRGLKAIAKDMGVPVIALSQLNRGVETRADKKPTLADLRESGAIEQDADTVMFSFPPAKFGISDFNGRDSKGIFVAIISKNRSGPVGEIELRHNESFSCIYQDYSEDFKANKDFDQLKSFGEPEFYKE